MNRTIAFGVAGLAVAAAMLGAGYYVGQKPAAVAAQPNERAEIEQIVRDYLVTNPEVMVEVQAALEAKQEMKQKEQQLAAISASKADIFDLTTDGVFGNPNGEITMVEFYDYNCGYCKRAFPDVNALIKDNPDLRVVLKEFPILGPDSQKAHTVSMAMKTLMPEKWNEFHDKLMAAAGKASDDNAIALALSLGADEAALRKEMANPAIAAQVQVTFRLADQLGITGTPSFVIGDEVVFGAVGKDALQDKIIEVRDQTSGS